MSRLIEFFKGFFATEGRTLIYRDALTGTLYILSEGCITSSQVEKRTDIPREIKTLIKCRTEYLHDVCTDDVTDVEEMMIGAIATELLGHFIPTRLTDDRQRKLWAPEFISGKLDFSTLLNKLGTYRHVMVENSKQVEFGGEILVQAVGKGTAEAKMLRRIMTVAMTGRMTVKHMMDIARIAWEGTKPTQIIPGDTLRLIAEARKIADRRIIVRA